MPSTFVAERRKPSGCSIVVAERREPSGCFTLERNGASGLLIECLTTKERRNHNPKRQRGMTLRPWLTLRVTKSTACKPSGLFERVDETLQVFTTGGLAPFRLECTP